MTPAEILLSARSPWGAAFLLVKRAPRARLDERDVPPEYEAAVSELLAAGILWRVDGVLRIGVVPADFPAKEAA